jgi:Zn-dependent protease with chaperone function
VAVDFGYNASTGRVGIRQRSELVIGLPLWIVLPPQLRVALLAHELGHAVNGDPTRGLLVRPALTTFSVLARATGAERTIGWVTSPDRPSRGFTQLLAEFVLWTVSRVFLFINLGLSALGARDHQRAEYLADAIAADLAGTEATVTLLDRLNLLPTIQVQLAYACQRTRPAEWAAAVDSYQASQHSQIPLLRQLSTRDTTLWSTHPPQGLRARMVEAAPARRPTLILSDQDSARIDAELALGYRATHRLMLGTREFLDIR